jgi:LPS O-antigen subunit length determinant protein (WzzB/FepE family)
MSDEHYEYYIRREKSYLGGPLFPIAVLILLFAFGIILSIIKWIALIYALFLIIKLVFAFVKSKNWYSDRPIRISENEAQNGEKITLVLVNIRSKPEIDVDILPGTVNGQKYVIKNVKIKNSLGLSLKKNIHFKIEIV